LGIVALAALTNRLIAKTLVKSRRCSKSSYRVHRRLIDPRYRSIKFIKDNLTFPPEGTDGASKLYLSILGAVAEFERSIIKQRQREGIDKAKSKGVYKGRKPTIDKDRILALRDQGLSTYKIAEAMGISRMTVHRALNG
jgi:DNA invertase Pin-like site-specific DNA recombinase